MMGEDEHEATTHFSDTLSDENAFRLQPPTPIGADFRGQRTCAG